MFVRSAVLAVLGIACFAGSAAAQSPAAARRALLFSTVAQGADVASTLTHPYWSRYEANALLPKTPAGLILTKGGIALLNVIVSRQAAQRHPRLIFWGQAALGGTLSYVAAHNVRSGMRLR